MLQAIREKAQGWIAWVIVILISVPFALWGVQEYLGIGGEPKVVKVNNREITERELDNAFHRFRTRLRDQLGENYRAGLIDDRLLKGQVLNSLIQQELLAQLAQRQGMNVSKQMIQREIASVPLYQKGGRFDYDTYQRALRQQGISSEYLAQQLRVGMVIDQLSQGLEQSAFTTQRELRESQRLREQRRELGYLLFAKDEFIDQQALDEADVQAYYEGHAADFKAPERVKLEYVSLSLEQLAKQVQFSDADLQTYLDNHRNEFLLPEERRVSHILVALEEGAEQAAKAKAEDLLQQLQKGGDFAALAKQHSDDPGSAPQGGDLGFFGRGVMDPAFEQAAFALDTDQISQLVRSSFGYHIIKLHEIRGNREADLAAVRDRVQSAYSREQARARFDEYFERLANLAYEIPDSLVPIEEELGLKLHSSDWISRAGGGVGPLASPKVINAAFSDEVLGRGNNSEPLEIDNDQVLVLRLLAHEPASTKPLDQVRPQVEQALRQQQAIQAAAQAGAQALEQLRSGKTLAELAETTTARLETPGLIDRFDAKLPPRLRNEAYRLPRPAEGQASHGGVELSNGDYAVMALTRVEDGSLGEQDPALRQGLDRTRANRYFELFVAALERQADIEVLDKKALAGD
ncbi:MAG: SurA N-terminal domain-containing protein [Gammaproteobacteria bacterium SHHR-1]|uniref:SurA N-terminal domain-containing protein n=1 Tax=Magnetovirga frankeli TaxID=947516 RepID=UPI001293D58F|nr:SurA N-terminal domain-containing protein [gamma proteobacterium SS-5]